MEDLGNAVIDLTADLTPLARKMAEARAMMEADLSGMEARGRVFDQRVAQIGANMNRTFLSPLQIAFDRAGASVGALDDRMRSLGVTVTAMKVPLAGLRASTDDVTRGLLVMRQTFGETIDDIRRGWTGTTALVVTGADAQVRAIDDVTSAWLREALAARLAHEAATGALGRPLGPGEIGVGQAGRTGLPAPAPVMTGGRETGTPAHPLIVAIESGQYAGLGSRAAAFAQPAISGAPERRALPPPGYTSYAPDWTYGLGGSRPMLGAPPVRPALPPAGGTSSPPNWVMGDPVPIPQPAATGGGDGGGFVPPIVPPAGGGDGGGGGDRGPGPVADAAFLKTLFWGGGSRWGRGRFFPGLGGARAGSIAALGGLDPMHYVTAAMGVAGFAGAGAAGGGLLAAGTLGQMAVGGGSDMAVMKSTITDTQALSKGLDNVSKAVAVYGAGSRQAAVAQAQLNAQMADLGNTAGVKAELGLAKATSALNKLWDTQTSGARVQAVKILMQGVQLGTDFVPRVARAAQENLAIINTGLKPLFAWLEGPQGVGIFNNLENNFRRNLPTAVHAFTQAVELLLRIVGIASDKTGGMSQSLDKLFTNLNRKPDAVLRTEIDKLIGDFRDWERLAKLLFEDITLLFKQDAGTGSAIVSTLTKMLQKLHDWETSTTGKSQLHTIFQVHRDEVVALLNLLPALLSPLSHLYMTVAPLLTQAFTGMLSALGSVLGVLTKLSPAFDYLFAGGLLLHHIGLLGTTVKMLGSAFGFMGGQVSETQALTLAVERQTAVLEANSAVKASNAAIPMGGGLVPTRTSTSTAGGAAGVGAADAAASEGATIERTLTSRIKGGVTLGVTRAMQGGMIALLGSTLSEVAGNAIGGGIGHGVKSAGTDASIGAGIGMMFGPEGVIPGAIGGAIVGGITSFIHSGSGDRAAKDLANKMTSGLPPAIQAQFGPQIAADLQSAHVDANRTNPALQPGASAQTDPAYGRRGPLAGQRPPAQGGGIGRPSPMQVQAFTADQLRKFEDAGKKAGQALAQGMTAAVVAGQYLSGAQLLANFHHAFGDPHIAQAAKEAGARQMLALAEGLNSQGKLPDNQLRLVIRRLQAQFPGLATFLQNQGVQWDALLSQSLHFVKGTDTLRNTLNDYRTQWTDFSIDQHITWGNIEQNTTQALADISQTVHTSTGQTRRDAIAEFAKLRHDSNVHMRGMAEDVKGSGALTAQHLTDAMSKMRTDASNEVYGFVSNLDTLMASGQIATATGGRLIADALNTILKTFGEGQLSLPQIQNATPAQLAAVASGQIGAGTFAEPHTDQGGLFQVGQRGARGPDNMRIKVGGQGIRVGDGEMVAVLNHDQQHALNSRLSDQGGLPGFFAQHNNPHHGGSRARGGPGYAQGGIALPLPTQYLHGGSVDQGVDYSAPGGTPEYAMGPGVITQEGIGGFGPNAPVLHVTSGPLAGRNIYYGHAGPNWKHTGQHVQAGEMISQVGSGIVGISTGPHIEVGFGPPFDVKGGPSAYEMLRIINSVLGGKMPSAAQIGGAMGGGTGPVWHDIKAPKVHGGGLMGSIVRGVLKRGTDAANKYGRSHMPGGTVGPISTVGGIMNIAKQAAKYAGVPWDSTITATLLSKESGGGQNLPAHNYGGALDPAGPFQVISGTFASYAAPGHTDRMNPVDNALAAFRYIKARYGTLQALAATTGLMGGGYKGYAQGGIVAGGLPVSPHPRHHRRSPHHRTHRPHRTTHPHDHGIVADGAPTTVPIDPLSPPTADQLSYFQAITRKMWNGLDALGAIPGGFSMPPFNVQQTGYLGDATMEARPYAQSGQVFYPWPAMHYAEDPESPYFQWASAAIIHETAHTMQSSKLAGNVTELEGGAQAWADEWAPFLVPNFAGANDSNYAGYVQTVKGMGLDWINHGQFGVGASAAGPAPRRPRGSRGRGGKGPKKSHITHARPHRLRRPPRESLKPPAGFDPTDLNSIDSLDQAISKMSSWQGYLSSLYGAVQVAPLTSTTDASGNTTQTVNWGDPNAPRGLLTGDIDPVTGRHTKGIYDRVREIGEWPGAEPFDTNTQLGVEAYMLNDYNREYVLAGHASQAFVPWLKKMKADSKARTDEVNRRKKEILELLGRKEYLTRRRERLAVDRKKRMDAITTAFIKARGRRVPQDVILSHLRIEENTALGGLPAQPPAGMIGSTTAWHQAKQEEQVAIRNQFEAARAAISSARAKDTLGLTLAEHKAKSATGTHFDEARVALDDDLRGIGQKVSGDRTIITAQSKFITSDREALNTATGTDDGTGSGGTKGKLLDLLDPQGSLAINVDTIRNINVPALLNEMSDLQGTKPPTPPAPSPSDQSSALLALQQQLNQQLALQLAVSQAQYDVLAKMPPFAGSFATGGVVPGRLGEAKTIIAHGGETITPAGQPTHDVHVHLASGMEWLGKYIDVRVQKRTRDMTRGAIRNLPGSGGGV